MKIKIVMFVLAIFSSRVLADSITFTENCKDTLFCETFEGETSCFIESKIEATGNAKLTIPGLQDVNFEDFDMVELTLGGLQFSFLFADAEDGRTQNRAVFVDRFFDEDDRPIDLGRLTLSRSGNVLTIAGNHKFLDSSIVCEQFKDEPGPFVDNLEGVEFSFSAGSVSVQRRLYFKGSTTITRRVVGSGEFPEEFFLSTVQAMGAADFTPPTITITSPKPNQRWSNEVFTVRCKATDNVAVQDVFIDINGDGYSAATLSEDGSVWTREVLLVPGTNTVRAYAIDRDDNHSKTNSQKVVFVVVSPLKLEVGLGGKVTGVISNQLLEVGKNYKVTAMASNSFSFVKWILQSDISGPIESTNAMLTFRMETNLCLRADFVDSTAPTVTITSPKPNQRWSNEVFTVRGKATDNVAVQDVFIDINGDGYSPAPLSDDDSEWTLNVSLAPGTNTVRAYAIDGVGNHSKTNSQKVVFVVVSPLKLEVGLGGKATGVISNQLLEVGKNYKVTAMPSNNFFFVKWIRQSDTSGPTESTNAKLDFRMETNLCLRAVFITNQFLAIKGVYSGLFAPLAVGGGFDVDITNSGFATLTLTDKGKFTGKLLLAGTMHPFSGGANVVDGTAHVVIKRAAQPFVNLDLGFDVEHGAETTGVTGRISHAVWEATLSAYRAATPAQGALFAGKHTFVIPGGEADQSATFPAGDGAGSVTVAPSGVLTLAGAVGDGTAISQSVPLSKDGDWPLYASLYGGKGLLWGWVNFSNPMPYRFEGDLTWIKRAGATADKFYTNGFAKAANEIVGAKYAPPGRGTNALTWPDTNGVVLIEGGNLALIEAGNLVLITISNAVSVVNNKVTVLANSNKVSVTLTPATGLFSGSFIHPVNGKTAMVKGALLQLPAPFYGWGSGWFRGTNESGYLRIESAAP